MCLSNSTAYLKPCLLPTSAATTEGFHWEVCHKQLCFTNNSPNAAEGNQPPAPGQDGSATAEQKGKFTFFFFYFFTDSKSSGFSISLAHIRRKLHERVCAHVTPS